MYVFMFCVQFSSSNMYLASAYNAFKYTQFYMLINFKHFILINKILPYYIWSLKNENHKSIRKS